MKAKFLIAARCIVAVVLVIAAASSKLYAIDGNNRYFAYGVGQRSCADYLKFRERTLETLESHERYTKDELYEIVDKIIEHWIAGFFTAHDFYVSDTYNVVGKTTMDQVKARLENLCRANPRQYFAEAVVTVAYELHPQRVKADPGK